MTADYADYDHHALGATYESIYETWRELLGKCPIGHSKAHDGMWVVTGYEESVGILRKPSAFSSYPASFPSFPQPNKMMPVELDPPDHQRYRSMVAEPFSPKRALSYEKPLRKIVNRLIDDFIEDGHCDVFETIGAPLPAMLATIFLGVPLDDATRMAGWIHTLVHETASRPEAAGEAVMSIYGYFGGLLAERAGGDGDELISIIARAEVDGQKLTQEELLGFSLFLLLASIDTSQKVIGSMFWRMANDPDLVARLVADPSAVPAAVEEFLRLYSPVIATRKVVEDTEVAGAELKAGDQVLLLLGAAGRDARTFPDPEVFSLGRENSAKHLAFGDYIHKCLGIHIVRVELRVLLEEFLRRIPKFEAQPGAESLWSNGQVQGVVKAPIRFPAGAREIPPG
ncbi:cytochrome P450 [uncultured Jatrophihabitans sp.]|uniref:cytochrome P450 n=1 Tax=uncultured Jatrophihabitans sp. TaxID=1610747 RepID=UPI0035CA5BE9